MTKLIVAFSDLKPMRLKSCAMGLGVPQALFRSATYQIIARSKTPISTSAIFTHHFNALSKVSLKFNVYNL